jgi:hypothetical protein
MFHVIGEIVVVHEVTLAVTVTNLKRIILACGDRKVIIITPGPRYLTQPCCCTAGHCIHLLVPESDLKMMADLAPPARVHPKEVKLQLQLPGYPGLRPAGWEKGRQPGGGLGGFLYLGGPYTDPLHPTRGWP